MYPTIVKFGTFHIGEISFPIAIHSYGLMMAFAFLSVLLGLQRELPRKKIDEKLASSIIFSALIGGVAGAKLYYAIQFRDLRGILSNSGLVWYGGLIGGSLAVLLTIYRSKNPILKSIDTIAPLLLLGYGIGRIGCLLSGDGCYGKPSSLPWAMAFPKGIIPTPPGIQVHPTPIYETIISLFGFGILWKFRRKIETTPGVLFGIAMIFAGIERFIVEFWRRNPIQFAGLTNGQFISFFMLIGGIILIRWASSRASVESL